MHRSSLFLAGGFALLAIAQACSSSTPHTIGSGAGADDDPSSSASTGTTGTTSGGGGGSTTATGAGGGASTTATTGTASTTTGSASTTTGGGCAMGGAPCQAFSDCCSGTCANQICTACGGEGQSCAQGCCNGLACYQNQCSSCTIDGLSCLNASDCCSNVCQQGTCAAGSSCSTCAEVLSGTGDFNDVCPGSVPAFNALFGCACDLSSACSDPCAANACQGNLADDSCTNCVQIFCPNEVNNCLAN